MGINKMYYTVYLAANDRIVGFGTARECARMMGLSEASFYSIVSRVRDGSNKKYEIYVEEIDD